MERTYTIFNEKIALKLRLEELEKREIRIAKECREEREWIFERLRKLDEQASYSTSTPNEAGLKDDRKNNKEGVIPFVVANDNVADTTEESIENEQVSVTKQEEPEDGKETLSDEMIQKILKEATFAQFNQFKELLKEEKAEKEELKKCLNESTNIIRQFETVIETLEDKEVEKSKQTKKSKRTSEKGRAITSPKEYEKLYKSALSILKNRDTSISSFELKKEIDNRTGKTIPNMTQFMRRLMKKDTNVKKPDRGEYIYESVKKEETKPLEQEPAEEAELAATATEENVVKAVSPHEEMAVIDNESSE